MFFWCFLDVCFLVFSRRVLFSGFSRRVFFLGFLWVGVWFFSMCFWFFSMIFEIKKTVTLFEEDKEGCTCDAHTFFVSKLDDILVMAQEDNFPVPGRRGDHALIQMRIPRGQQGIHFEVDG